MPLTHAVQAGPLTVTVRELTVREVRDWAQSIEMGLIKVDAVAFMAMEDASLQDLEFMTDKAVADLEALAPSELAGVVAMCRKLNPHFFRLRAAMSGAALVMREEALRPASSAPVSH